MRPTQQGQKRYQLAGICPEVWKGFGLRKGGIQTADSKEGHGSYGLSQAQQGQVTGRKRKSTGKSCTITTKLLPLTPCISRMLLMAGTEQQAKERGLNNKAVHKHELSRE